MLRGGLTHPLAIAILGASVLCAVAVQLWAPWSARAPWFVVWGIVGYVAAALAVQRRTLPGITDSANVAAATVISAEAVQTLEAPASLDDLVRLTEDALRHLNNPALLAASGLLAKLPYTLAVELPAGATDGAARPLDQARAMRRLLEASIERLKPATQAESPAKEAELLQYAIIHEEYVDARPNNQIIARHSIAESTFHRHRRQGIRALAEDLALHEQQLRHGQPGH